MRNRSNLSPTGRVFAIMLTMVWLATGVITIAIGITRDHWMALLFGILALAYGVVWFQVARTGRLLKWSPRHNKSKGGTNKT
jgi:hypothetical protein